MFSNPLTSTFGQLASPGSSTCIFSKLSTTGFNNIGQTLDKPKPCSTEKFRPSAILCAEHLKAYFNMGIKQETAKPSDNSQYIKFFSLKFSASPDVLLPFPMKLRPKRCQNETKDVKFDKISDFEFCLDQSAIQSGFSGSANYLPPQILGTLLTNSHLSDIYISNMSAPVSISPGVGQAYTPLLMANTMILEKYWENVDLLAISETKDEAFKDIKNTSGYLKIPMSMLPGFYKFIFYYAAISNLASTKSEVVNEYQVMPPNVILNLDSQAFEIVNKGAHNKIFTYGGPEGIETITTPIILCAEKRVPDIKREISPHNLTSLMTHVPICTM
jgi:hypothetical protein